MALKNNNYPQIFINERAFGHDVFKIHELEEDEIPRLMESIETAASQIKASDTDKDIQEIMSFTPLIHLEGLVRHQLNRLLHNTYVSNEDLKVPSDFIHKEIHIRDMGCIKTSFLFLFLHDILSMKLSPKLIDYRSIAKLESNLRGLFFLAESQLTGSKKYKPQGFRHFAYLVWKKSTLKKLSTHDFWSYASKELQKYPYEVKFVVSKKPYSVSGRDKKEDVFTVTKKLDTILITCESNDIPDEKPRTKEWVSRNWPKLNKEFSRNDK